MEHEIGTPIGEVIEDAGLFEVIERLPDGMKTVLGEGGGLVSGGEGQRVRLGRALFRLGTRLVILDEPFRGLDREKRRALLSEARRHWVGTTLICITHDVGETLEFDRVVVMDKGRIIEHGTPHQLVEQPTSRYAAILAAEKTVRQELWAGTEWQRLSIERGRLSTR